MNDMGYCTRMDNKEEILQDLKNELKLAEISQAWAARKLGVTPMYFGHVLLGKAQPSLELLQRVVTLRDKLRTADLRAV